MRETLRAVDVLRAEGLLSQALSTHRVREAQLDMAALVERCLDGDGVGLIEAGTGTGKTFAYLVPALLSGRKVVISTGTKALQDQIALRDVPTLERAFGQKLPVAVLKGLGNYLCVRRFDELLSSAESVTRKEIVKHLPLLQEFRLRSRTGEKRDLAEVPEDAAIWPFVVASSETRIGKRCPFADECFVSAARAQAEEARVIVVNHHLFFADIALRRKNPSAGVIPPYDAVIFDEAHQLEDVLTQFAGIQIGGPRLDSLARDVDRSLAREDGDHGALLRTLMYRASDVFEALPRSQYRTDGGFRGEGMKVPFPVSMRTSVFEERCHLLDAALEALSAHCGNAVENEAALSAKRRIDELRDDLITVLEASDHGDYVVYTEMRGRTVWLCASPVEVAKTFARDVLMQTPSVILTSATLSSAGSFSFIRSRLGIAGEIDEALLSSPFDVAKQAGLFLPDMPDPRDPRFLPEAVKTIRSLVSASDGGAFVLTTSIRVMTELHQQLQMVFEDLGLEVLLQGTAPKNDLLDRFRRSGRAVLFATQSFWEGVDVPGHALRLVIIDKLPFEVPTDPLVQARCERIEAQGQNPFMEYLVPSAALALKQGFGRLLRTESDRGVVAILDPRITTKGYGKTFLRSLPPATRLTGLDEATAYLRDLTAVHEVGEFVPAAEQDEGSE